MKSASKNWFLLCLALVLFNCGSSKPQPEARPIIPMEKAYVLLRSEGGENDLTELKSILNSDFITNNISTNIVTYPLGRAWNNNQIFTTAYNEKYDYIVLIDQVAKFTIDNRTQVGGKYQIRSYHVKSPNPDWVDLGQKTCNISVKPSIKKFAQQIVSNIVPNYKSSIVSYNEDVANTDNSSNSGYQTFKTSKEIDVEIEELKHQLKIEKEKTNKVIAEKERLAQQYEENLAKEKQKTELALASLKLAKKEKEEITRLKKEEELNRRKQRQKEITVAIVSKREEIRKKEVDETLKNSPAVASVIKEPTREERLIERQEVKKRLAEEKALARQKQEDEAIKRQEERKDLAEARRNEQKRLKQELVNQKKEEKRLAQTKKDQELLELKKQEEKERLAILDEAKRIEAKEEEERLSKLLKEKQELAEAELIENARIEKRKAKEKRDQELLEIKQKQEKERLATLNEAKKIEAKEEEKRLSKLLKEKQELAKAKKIEEDRIEKEKIKAEEKRLAQVKKEEDKRLADLAEAKRIEAERVLEKQKLTREEKRLAQAKKEQEEFELKQQLKEKRRLAQVEEKATKKQVVKNTPKAKKKSPNKRTPNDGKTNTLVVLRAKKGDADHLKKLQDNIEFDLLFVKARATTKIYDSSHELNLNTIFNSNKSKYDVVIVVNQLDYKGDGYSNYQISKYNYNTDSNWNKLDIQAYKIVDRASLKEFSKTIATSL